MGHFKDLKAWQHARSLAVLSKAAIAQLPESEREGLADQWKRASYSVVLVPTFNDPQDRIALGILAELIKDRPIVGIHAVDLVWGLGTLHCLTQQEPALES